MELTSQALSFLLETDAELHALTVDADLCALAAEDRAQYRTNYIGSKQKLVAWIGEHTPKDAATAFDAFSGSSVVGYFYKTKGLGVTANDALRYAWHIARAIIENGDQKLSDAEIEALLADNPKADDFVQKTFEGLYFAPGVHALIDTVRANIEALSGYQKDIALFALGKSCITAKAGFGHFSSSGSFREGDSDSPEEFRTRFGANCRTISSLVFANRKDCKALTGDIRAVAAQAKTDLAYFDPPYATQFSNVNYERSYHFIEGLMTNWDGKTINADSKLKTYQIPSNSITPKNAQGFFAEFLGACAHIPHWLISYRDKAYPTEEQVQQIVADLGRESRMESKTHHYQLSAKHGENSTAQERLFICTATDAAKQAAEEGDAAEHLLETFGDVEFLEALRATAEHVRVTQYMGNKLFLLDLLWKNTPANAGSVLDVFSGGSNVAYFYKQKGLRVVANDKLKYPFHIARAVVENSKETLSDADIEALLADNPKKRTFIADTFDGYYWTRPILEWLDTVRSNIEALSGYKRDLALFALGRTCTIHARFGQFSRSKKSMTGNPEDESRKDTILGDMPLEDFVAQFRKVLGKINGLVFDNGQKSEARNGDALEAMRNVEADVCYCDPPYVTEFGTNDYEANLHFVEGLMTYWEGKELRDNARRDFASTTKYTKATIGPLFSEIVAAGREKFEHLLISYRDRAFPSENEIKTLLADKYPDVTVRSLDVRYNMVKYETKSGGRQARELLFVASTGKALKTAASLPLHTRMVGEILPLAATADLAGPPGQTDDRFFRFILCHEGMNKNGDFFLPEELQAAYPTIINRKVDLKHSQDITDYVGNVTASDVLTDATGMRIEATGKLYVGTTEYAALAYKLMKEGVIAQVSMECDYQQGECSICGKKVASKAEYCQHLKSSKGAQFQGQPCYEILHGVAFSGVGLLDRKGADENARILQVAHLQAAASACPPCSHSLNPPERSPIMPEPNEAAKDQAAKKQEPGGGGGEMPPNAPPPGQEPNKDAQIKQLQKENTALKQQVSDLQKQIQDLEQQARATSNRARAEKLVKKLEKKGLDFGEEESRTAEVERLAGLTDEAFTAAEQTYERLLPQANAEPEKTPDAQASVKGAPLSAAATVRPYRSEDKNVSLEEQLRRGIGASWADRNRRHQLAAKE